ncbi:16S rRNA (guanine(527)-N(7))-methyltransferase RsmG [Desulfoscipio sp. XC116]|uniref:16S rRNA (guanine(527)-N(7))-methyltransferase RsmG n=1 Tax=Desulfoscipio sp. XC116 TaxID=3144975 RepID=UPI00325B0F37
MNDLFRQTVEQGCKILGIEITSAIIDKFEIYYQMLYKSNKEYNLTSITETVEAAEKHFIDSLTLYREISAVTGALVIDIGSGAGFPGLPLKIYNSNIDMTLVDSVGKKVKFMQQVIQELKLVKTIALKARAEDLAADSREKYDAAISRAVAELRVLVEYALPLVKVGGVFIAAKGPKIEEELNLADRAIKILGGKIMSIRKVSLPINNEGRTIVTIKKVGHTPGKYPRKAGIPKKRPL